MPRLLRTVALAGLAYGAWVWLKGLLDEPPHPIGQEAPTDATPKQAKPASPAAKSAPSNGGGATKAELYERATELEIKGRSKMSKAELERAIRDAD